MDNHLLCFLGGNRLLWWLVIRKMHLSSSWARIEPPAKKFKIFCSSIEVLPDLEGICLIIIGTLHTRWLKFKYLHAGGNFCFNKFVTLIIVYFLLCFREPMKSLP